MSLLLLDSGAFSVWNRGLEIDLDKYIKFCVDHSGCSYYVNLDVIPGKPGVPKQPGEIEEACQQGWDNYLRMLEQLPKEKVIPVFHQGDSEAWLEKYLEFGTPYIGISPANDRTTGQKLEWLKRIKKFLFDSDGNPTAKTHGFAVTSFRLMKEMQWHSVDSASWVRSAAYGTIYVPIPARSAITSSPYRYDESPFLLSMSPKSPSVEDYGGHISGLTEHQKTWIGDYIHDVLKMTLGEFEIVGVPEGYKKQKGELWSGGLENEKAIFGGVTTKPVEKRTSVMRIISKGLITCHQRRFWANMKFLQEANKVLPVDNLYFAGAGGSLKDQIEFKLGRRLMSYHEVTATKGAGKVFDQYMELLT